MLTTMNCKINPTMSKYEEPRRFKTKTQVSSNPRSEQKFKHINCRGYQ